jgi:integrase
MGVDMGVKIREKPKGSGVWWIFINHNGKRKSKRVGNEKAAREAAEKIEARLVLGQYNIHEEKKQALTFKEFTEMWLQSYIIPLRRQSTYERYCNVLKGYVYPVIGHIPIDQIKRQDIRNLLLKIHGKGKSRSMLCIARDVISGSMGYAVEDEIIQVNPVTGVLKRLKLERERQLKIEPMNFEDVDLFLNICKRTSPEYYPLFLCAFRTGMRLGELIALHWGDIDWNKRNIKVERSYRRGMLNNTKTDKSRIVDMSNQLTETLRNHLTKAKKEALEQGRGEVVDIVFHRAGSYLEQNYIRRVFKRVLRSAGLRDTKVHITRHTFASLLLTNGESPVYVKEQLGHSSIDITVDIYGHLIPNSNRDAVNRLDMMHPSAPQAHPVKTEKPQPFEIVANSY